jgi:serine/threonine-protein kinase
MMRVLVVAAPVPHSSTVAEVQGALAATALAAAPALLPLPTELPTEREVIASTTNSAPADEPEVDDEPAREVAPARRPAVPARTRAHAKKAKRAGAGDGSSGTLRINSLPWAEVYLDGTSVGPTPKANLALKPGRHRVKLVNQPMAMSKTFDVYIRSGEVVTRSVNLSM